ncbi:MAG: nucleotide exchange factor GrpE [Candidatus Aquicultorales bacterium]
MSKEPMNGDVKRAGLEERLAELEQELADKEAELEAVKEELESKSAESKEYLESLQRLQADSENFRKRMIREQSQAIEFASESIICKLLPLVDSLERAAAACKGSPEADKIAEGVHMIHSQLLAVLEQSGLEAINAEGNEFDPQFHEAVLQVESEEHDENTVLEVMQKGYCLKGKVVRPAMVKVTRKS